jgi:hypothetical protein
MEALLAEDRCEELRDLSVVNLIVSMYDRRPLPA